MRTEEEIQKEVEALKKIRPHVIPYSVFGDDNIFKLDLMIDILVEGLDEYDLSDMLENEEIDEETFSEVQRVFNWLDGEDEDRPSEGWPIKKE